MKVKLLQKPTIGPKPWPKVGTVVDLELTQALFLVRHGIAEEVGDEKPTTKKK